MIAQVLFSLQFIAVVSLDYGWIPCSEWDPHKHCYFKGVDDWSECGDIPCVKTAGAYYDGDEADWYVCDQNNEVYKQIYLAEAVVEDANANPDKLNEKTIHDFDDPSCFEVGNDPDSALIQDCWSYVGNQRNEEGEHRSSVTSLDQCKAACLGEAACVAISYITPSAGEASPIGNTSDSSNPYGGCYTLEGYDANDNEADDDSYLFRRIPCNVAAALTPKARTNYRL